MHKPSLHASMSAEELLVRYRETGSSELQNQIVEMHLYIASIVARRFSGRGVDFDDLYQVASLALFKAIDRFDISKGIKFVSFAVPNMVGEVKNYFRDRSRAIRLPRRGVQLMQAIQNARTELEQMLLRAPRVDELAEHMGIPEDTVLEGLELGGATTVTSLDAQIAEEDDDTPLSAFLGIEESGFEQFDRHDMLGRAMSALDARQREVIKMRFFENLSQRDVAAQLNISQMTVSRAERQALTILREQIKYDQEKSI